MIVTGEFLSLRLHTFYLRQAAECAIGISGLLQDSVMLSEGLKGTAIKSEAEVKRPVQNQ